MENLGELKNVAIQDDSNNATPIFADDVSASNIISTFLVFASFFLIILVLGIFAPKQSEVICSTLSINPNVNRKDIFKSVITNLSPINQKLRISILYDNATLDKKLSSAAKTFVTVDSYSKKGKKLDSASNSNSISFDRPVPLFQTSIINFEKLELSASIDTKLEANHTINLKYEFVSAEASFFQLKVRLILSIISIGTLTYCIRTITRSVPQIMTLFVHVATLLVFNPLHIIFIYKPSITFLCFDLIFRNVGISYIYVYSCLIYFAFDERISKGVIIMNILMFAIVFLLLLSKDFIALMESFPTVFPLEFNGMYYNTDRFMKDAVTNQRSSDTNSIYKQTADSALKLAFLSTATINETDMGLKEFSILILFFFAPLFISIIYSIFNVQDVFFNRIVVFASTISIFALGMTIFYACDVINAVFHGKLIRWLAPLASLSTFSLIMTFLNMEDDRNKAYEYMMADEGNGIDIMDEEKMINDDNNDTLGLEEDDEQMKRKNEIEHK